MNNHDKIIHNMCLTIRHDYDLVKPDPETAQYSSDVRYNMSPLSSGMTIKEREFLRRQMSQVYYNVILPAFDKK